MVSTFRDISVESGTYEKYELIHWVISWQVLPINKQYAEYDYKRENHFR